jgi:TatD DNase family protein
VSAPGLIDTHAHLMDPAFTTDLADVVARAHAAGVSAMLLVGYDLASSRAAVELARTVPGTRAAVGIHPNSASEARPADFETIEALAAAPEVVAIGETGLDNYRQFTPPARQREAFEWHLRLAEARGLPVIVHNRQADAEIADLATRHSVGGVLHCFSSDDAAYLERMLDLGFHVSFAGPLTFKNKSAAATRAVAARVPRDRLLVETDCPYLAPEPHRGQRNEPAFVRDTAECLANVVGASLDDLSHALWSNSLRLFAGLDRAVAA